MNDQSPSEMTVTATEANRSFAKLLRLVREGRRVRITSHGETVAVIAPPEEEAGQAERQRRAEALVELQRHWATLEPMTVGPWSREEFYNRD